jgi:Tfp pilus assembly protein PilF
LEFDEGGQSMATAPKRVKTASSKGSILKDIAVRLIWIFVGMVVVLTVQEPLKRRWEKRQVPDQTLKEADGLRLQFTEPGITAAIEKSKPLAENAKLSSDVRSRAYVELSRAYSDLAALRYRMGLARGAYPDLALSAAVEASRFAKGRPAEVALAYAVDAIETYPDHGEKPSTKEKVSQLQRSQDPDRASQLDVRYLEWQSTASPSAGAFPDAFNPEETSDVRILIDVGLSYAVGEASHNPIDKEKLKRSSEICHRAATLQPQNALAHFCLGYSEMVRGNPSQAQTEYKRAIEDADQFPRARNNLGYAYALQGEWKAAFEQFDAAVRTPEAPIQARITWLNNLAGSYLERHETDAACEKWGDAMQLPGGEQDFKVEEGMALCAWIRGDGPMARKYYKRSADLAIQQGITLWKIDSFKKNLSPVELPLVTAIINSCKTKAPAKSPGGNPDPCS